MIVNNLIYDNEISESIIYSHWKEFVYKYESLPNIQRDFLFRGQSNFIDDENKNKWKPYGLKTTLQRKYFGANSNELINTLDYFIKYKDKYRSLSKLNFTNTENYLSLILYLRHAGIPMPVLDVTFDPLTALYFAVHDLIIAYGVTSCKNEDDIRYISIFEFDKSVLIEHYGAKEIREIKFLQSGTVNTVLLITEIEKLAFHNANMLKQNGAFIFLSSNHSLDVHLNNINELQYKTTFKELPKAIKHHKIPFKSVIPEFGDRANVFKYLASKSKAGFSLFEDAQALLFDFKNPYFINVFC
ncbi:MAG: FRG domain-containing protein [Bacteroidota bacterium]